jgi:hypothetical protein
MIPINAYKLVHWPHNRLKKIGRITGDNIVPQEIDMATLPVASSSGQSPLLDELKSKFDPALYNFLFTLFPRLMGKMIDVESGTDIIYGQYAESIIIKQELDDDQVHKLMMQLITNLREVPFFQANSRSPLISMGKAMDDGEDLTRGFYWYDTGDAGKAQKRVYVHANGLEGAIAVMDCLAGEVRGDVRGVKLWGPYWWNQKMDTIVVYCTSEEGQSRILQAVAGLRPAAFQAGLPAFVKLIALGVGIADNPPQVKLFEEDEEVQSFGKFMSKLICLAYIHRVGPEVSGFLRQVLVAFRVAQINPLRPHEHSRRAEVESMKANLYRMLDAELKKVS